MNFEALLTDTPPSTVDVPRIVRGERRRRRLLRAGVPAAAVLAAASAVALLAPGGDPAAVPPSARSTASAPVPASASAPASAPGFRLVADSQAAIANTATALRAALDSAVHQAAPGATWHALNSKLATPDGQPPRIYGDNLAAPTEQMFVGTTGISVDGRLGTLQLEIVAIDKCPGGGFAKCSPSAPVDMKEGLFGCQPAAQKCTAGTGAKGRRQRVQTSLGADGFVSQETNVELADGRALMLMVSNQYIAPGGGTEGSVRQAATPLTEAQITAIATAIGDQILA
jgi:hypothetical protein